MIINMMILEVRSTTYKRYFLNANQIAWMRANDRSGTKIVMSDGTEIIVYDDVEDVLRSLCVSERSSAHNFDEGETAVIPKVELTGEEASDNKQAISYGCSTPEAEGLMHRMFDKLFEPPKEE